MNTVVAVKVQITFNVLLLLREKKQPKKFFHYIFRDNFLLLFHGKARYTAKSLIHTGPSMAKCHKVNQYFNKF